MRTLHGAVFVGIGGIVLVSSASCLDPTQITLAVTTDVRCDVTKGTSFTGGDEPFATENAAPSSSTSRCVDGDVGTLVASPTDKDGRAVFVITMGVDVPVSECTAAKGYKGCIVQRRSLRYVKHTPLTLPIAMLLLCKDTVCDVNSTCARSGKCVPSEITDPSSCASGDCYPEGDEPPPKPGEDGGPDGPRPPDDGSLTDGNPNDGSPGDGSPGDGSPGDGSPGDGGLDGTVVTDSGPPPLGRLYCPPVVLGCMLGDNCCWDKKGLGGVCAGGAGVPCPPARNLIPMKCNQKPDCLVTDHCCATVVSVDNGRGVTRDVLSTQCQMVGGPACLGPWICLQNSDCPTGTCDKNTTLFQPPGVYGECIP